MPLRRLRTLSIVRLLRHIGPLHPRRARPPRAHQPDLIRKEYLTALMPFVRAATAEVDRVRGHIVRLLKEERAEQAGRMDADDRKARAKELLAQAAARAAAAWRPTEVYAVAKKFGQRTNDFQRAQLDQQVRSAMGVSLSMIERPITAKLEGFAALNVDLIKTVPERYFDRIRMDVEDAFDSGMEPDTLADLFIERDGMAENDARRIARDQIGKLNGQLNEERQTAMGVSGYIWRTANDSRVRDEHADREGQHFDWDDPPEDGHPGEPIQCRCFAEPDLDPILEDIDEG